VQSFTSVGTTTWTAPAGVTSVEVLVVAGGGAGGGIGSNYTGSAGGGAGGLIYNSNFAVTPGTAYTVTVGAGGTASSSAANGANGSNSVFSSLTAIGGGGGATGSMGSTQTGNTGGSGGGSCGQSEVPATGANGTIGQGNPGGGFRGSGYRGGGAGGGAGQAGATNLAALGLATGGAGLQFVITGTPIYYAGGGGGSSNSGAQSSGGIGGGGAGGIAGGSISELNGTAGTANTGGGGGGCTSNNVNYGTPGSGGSGVVVLRYVRDADNEDPAGQVRFNSSLKLSENFSKNKWTRQTSSDGIVTNGLALWLDASKYSGSGTSWTDLSDYSNNATLTNSPGYSTDNQGYFTLTSGTDRIIAGNTGLNHGLGDFTYSCWINHTTVNSGSTYFENGLYTGGILIRHQTNTIAVYAMTNERGSFSFTPTPGQWYNLTFTKRGSDLYCYIDGVEHPTIISLSGVNIVTSTNFIWLGESQHNSSDSFQGRYAIALVYNRGLSAEEIKQNYTAHVTRFEQKSSNLSPANEIAPGIVRTSLRAYYDPAVSYTNLDNRKILYDLVGGAHLINSGATTWNRGGYFSQSSGSNYSYFAASNGVAKTLGELRSTTIELWAYWTGNTGGNDDYIFNIFSGDSGQQSRALRIVSGSLASIGNGSSAQDENSIVTLQTNRWYSIVLTHTEVNTVNLYLDNVRYGPYTKTLSLGSAGGINLGNTFWYGANNANVWQGRLGVFKIYDRTLNSDELTQNFQALRGRYGI
jgi:hypothetical protein